VLLGDGKLTHMSSRIVPFRGPQGEELALLLTRDVTQQRQLMDDLQQSLEFRRRVVEHLPDFVSLVDAEGRFMWVNRLAPGLSPERVIGKKMREFSSPETMPAQQSAVRAAFESGTIQQYDVEGYGDGSSTAWYHSRVVPVRSEDKVEHVLIITSDITERKRTEQALRAAEERLHRAQRLESLGQLAGGIAHDFNNLIQVIAGNLAFARESLANGESAFEELEQAMRAADRAADLTSHLLAVGRRKRVDRKRVDLGSLIDHSVRMLRRAMPENIRLVYEPAPEHFFVEIDAPQFEQVFINLCVNARDAMPDGGTLRILLQPDGSEHVLLCVRDTGVGIAPENLARVFEPFFTTKGTGSGLGLAVAAGIIAAHGGVIIPESQPGQGTTMSIRLPRVAAASQPPPRPGLREQPAAGVILIAEDEALVRAQLARTLERAGYRVLQAEHGSRAVELFRAHQREIDLVILDVIMPELDGWQVFLRISELEPSVRVLFTTGYSANALPEDSVAREPRLLQKPYNPAVLLELVRELMLSVPRRVNASSPE
jgi:two-component system cell cycle sensor histidine kinase/response regulator CckA